MQFLELAKSRYSSRKYLNKPVEDEKLNLILEAGRVAPTGCNKQPYAMIVAKTREDLEKLQKAGRFFGAPVCILVCADHAQSWKRPIDGKDIAEIDASIVTTHMMLQATELGLGSVWICHFDPEAVRREFSISGHMEPLNILAVGYSDDTPKSPGRHAAERKALEETML